jgi:hypothetical protein
MSFGINFITFPSLTLSMQKLYNPSFSIGKRVIFSKAFSWRNPSLGEFGVFLGT